MSRKKTDHHNQTRQSINIEYYAQCKDRSLTTAVKLHQRPPLAIAKNDQHCIAPRRINSRVKLALLNKEAQLRTTPVNFYLQESAQSKTAAVALERLWVATLHVPVMIC